MNRELDRRGYIRLERVSQALAILHRAGVLRRDYLHVVALVAAPSPERREVASQGRSHTSTPSTKTRPSDWLTMRAMDVHPAKDALRETAAEERMAV
jgi:hypothetical protein